MVDSAAEAAAVAASRRVAVAILAVEGLPVAGEHAPSGNALLRWLRHLWMDEDSVRRQIGTAGLERLHAQVQASETRHLGELRLCIEGGLGWEDLRNRTSARERALHLFSTLHVWDTQHNNGVLIYLLLADRRIEILADRGITGRVSTDAWPHIAQQLGAQLREGRFEQGLTQAIEAVTQLLTTHFPVDPDRDNPNELPDQVVVI
jgi:hypothetical protein